ncbi:E3 ubiquitin-protein ligase COP1 [Spodoptera frugiperda]|uniref:E3 ubiquitin-protein ligase COP1 n=1 Tax=Spodoptera frugiperda TaxID=7108 RepID=A0A9R0DHJ3_SPOFR|nr:E3 ubiquitin-protein ligase COP1 [Spodoptera frugiperda]
MSGVTAGGSAGGAAGGGAGGGAAPLAALGGLGGSLEDKDCDLLCPVCFELIDEAYVTRCGHSFCYACISKAVELHRRCPKCGAALASRDHIFPNFLLNEVVARRRAPAPAPAGGAAPSVRALVAAEARRLPLADVDAMLELLARRKRLLQAESAAAHHRLLYEFLAQLHRTRSLQLEALAREAALVRRDMATVAAVLRQLPPDPEPAPAASAASTVSDPATAPPQSSTPAPLAPLAPPATEDDESFAGGSAPPGDALAARWRRLHAHFDDFVQCYFAHRADELYFPGSSALTPASPAFPGDCSTAPPAPPAVSPPAPSALDADHVPQAPMERAPGGDQRAPDAPVPEPEPAPPLPPEPDADADSRAALRPRGLDAFREDLVAFTRYRALRPLATLSYCSDAINYSTIVSTIEFDKDEEFFAIAGVTKRIKVFEYEAVVRDCVDVHYPCAEMQCSHKISCVSWNAYHKNVLASSDYEGTVSVWDAGTGQRTRALHEHDKRCWSVHFNRADVRLLASGSDDARVKLWALNAERSVATLEAKFNVCCVRFNPRSSCHLAFGSADHCVHYYDLRAPRAPLAVFRDHRKAVSYVKFLDARTLVSASTDSALKLWRVESPRCVRSFTGHANEKNFVGLATDGRYVACGSENNALYVYYAGLSRPLLVYRFDAVRGFLERERRDEEPSEFVSAVCWRRAQGPDSHTLLAANSQGTIKVLELV